MAQSIMTRKWFRTVASAAACLGALNVVALAAVDSRSGDSPATASPTKSSAIDGQAAPVREQAPRTAVVGKPGTANSPAATTTTTTPVGEPTSAPPMLDGYTYEVTLAPLCAHPGDLMRVTLRLKPWGGGAFIATYSDGLVHESYAGKVAREDGTATYEWVAPAVPGDAVMTTTARDPESGRNGRTDVKFRIVESGLPC